MVIVGELLSFELFLELSYSNIGPAIELLHLWLNELLL